MHSDSLCKSSKLCSVAIWFELELNTGDIDGNLAEQIKCFMIIFQINPFLCVPGCCIVLN